jgi:hypothetical protein
MSHPIYGTFDNFKEHFLTSSINYFVETDCFTRLNHIRTSKNWNARFDENVLTHIFKDPFIPYDNSFKDAITEHHLKLMRHPLFFLSYANRVVAAYSNPKGVVLETNFDFDKIKIVKNLYSHNILAFYHDRWYLCKSRELLLYHMLTQC